MFWYYYTALVLLNLISLWVDSETNRRIIFLSLSLYGHFIYMQHLYWTVPFNGDSVPDIGKRHSNQSPYLTQITYYLDH